MIRPITWNRIEIYIWRILFAISLMCGIYSFYKIDSSIIRFELALTMILYTQGIICIFHTNLYRWNLALAVISTVLMIIFMLIQILLAFMNASAKEGGFAYKIATWVFICYTFEAWGLPLISLLLRWNDK